MIFLIFIASLSFIGIFAMISVRLWQIKSGKVTVNGGGAPFWSKTYEAILIGESKVIDFLAKLFKFCGDKLSKLGLSSKIHSLLNWLLGGVHEKIIDIRKTIKGEGVLAEKENTSDFLKDISNHKENTKNGETIQ